jgi:hypothetical protein
MLSKDEQIANLERQVRELDERYTQALVSINRLNNDTGLLLTSQEVKDNANIALKAEVARLRSENTTLKLMLDGADVIERSMRQRLESKS